MLEMLTVAGIIVLLMAILLPVVSKIRVQAANTATLNQINQIGAAIERYRGDHNAFPGVFPNTAFDNNGLCSVGTFNITMTENAVLALCGGWEPPNSGPAFYNPDNVGLGPMTHVANAMRRKRYPAYLDPTPRQMMPDKPWNDPGQPTAPGAGNGKTGISDCFVPEFVDRYQTSKPILYMRANVGAPGVVVDAGNTYMSGGFPSGASFYQYNLAWLKPYIGPPNPKTFNSADFPQRTDSTNTNIPAGAPAYFTHPTLSGVPHGKDGYVLISAGPDNIYGTKDDILYP